MSTRVLGAVLALAACLGAQPPVPVHRPLTPATYAAWREHILPSAAELRWATIPWRQSFGDGLRAASEQGKPLLLYAMNGHPLGCT